MSSQSPGFFIVTTVRNGQPFLSRAIESVTSQTYSNWRYLIIDAGSDDGSLDVARAAADQDERIELAERPGEPLYQSLLWGLSQADGDMLAWLNADDYYAPWALQSLATHLAGTPAQWVSGLPVCWDETGAMQFLRPRGLHPQSWIAKGSFHLGALGFLQQETIFFSRSLFERLTDEERATFARQKLAGDYFLWKTFARHTPLKTLPCVLGGFRKHGRNMSGDHLDTYMAEVREIGGFFPSPRFAFMLRRAYEAIAALKTLRIMREAEARFLDEGSQKGD